MPFRWSCLLLHRTDMAYCLLVQGHQLLCLGVKILSRRGQQHLAGHMLEQFNLQLPFQGADLLRQGRLRQIQCFGRRRIAVQLHDLHKTFQCALVHSGHPPTNTLASPKL